MAISLVKGQKISLEKSDGQQLTNICVGVNWGAIMERNFLGRSKAVAVDLDASAITFDVNSNVLDVVYFGKLSAQGIQHSGDDLVGDVGGDDGLDNEIIDVRLNQLPSNVDKIAFVLNSFNRQDFKNIPFASIPVFEGSMTHIDKVHAQFDIANDPKFAGSVSMVLAKMYKHNGNWKLAAIGEVTRDQSLENTVATVQNAYI
ncbi:TerD family protein [Vibrio ulleungensis]|uniref:Tellurium resistance TerZ family protein n=1 Tax=Vibrio ulleungensis TaxID=2807619 RepID=A0ABS2HFD2_9VIBR|nr:TerD family protein [Vibrio ulleungensis]MBM7034769.1 tellurium resistance TerZ family protein [Vibrio ulleungensis]